MLKRSCFCVCLLALSLLLSSTASASIHTLAAGDQIRLRYNPVNYRTGNGGEFQVDKLTGSDAQNNYFHTFCAEIGENITNNVVATVVSTGLTTYASNPFNTMTMGAAKLYRDYYNGIAANNFGFQGGPPLNNFGLAGGTFTFDLAGSDSTRAADGRAVQLALWTMIGESVTLNAAAQSLVTWYTDGNNVAFDANYYGVRFATLQDANGKNLQDQFAIVHMPEPTSLLVWGGIGVACIVRRRRR